MKIEVYEFLGKRYGISENQKIKIEVIDLLKIDYLIILEKSFYADFKVKTFDNRGTCECLSALAVISVYKKTNRLILQYNNVNYEIFEKDGNNYLILDKPKIMYRYKDNYLICFYNCYYWICFNNYLRKDKKKRKYIILDKENNIISCDDFYLGLILKEYLLDLKTVNYIKKISCKDSFNRNLLVKLESVNYLYKCYITKKELAA
ncbi:MAG: hypothetical protein E7184_02550 [Erysipelotrichaceae bacterium]|nr:hypothetical protein [Erysipelotrichaceae bacterium]